jgi:hypothetical protein
MRRAVALSVAVETFELAKLFNGLRQFERYEARHRERSLVGRTQTMVDCTSRLSHAMPFGSRPGSGLTAYGAA